MGKYNDSKFIFVTGIGGSDLASKAVWNAMTLHRPDVEKPASSAGKKIFFLESPEESEYEEIRDVVRDDILNPDEFVLIAISKSGKTAETLESFHKISDILSEKFSNFVAERTIIISTKNTPLWELAVKNEIKTIEWEGEIGGRFSAFTVAHTTVLDIAGLDTKAFKTGGKEMDSKCAETATDNPAKHLAKNIFGQYEKGADILDFFIFNSELEDLGKWCRQLIAESLSTITPTVSLGPTDLHSMLELYLGGPKNRFTVFIKSTNEIGDGVNESAYENVTKAYEKAELPFMKYEMAKIDERELGNFMAFMIKTTKELAKLLGVDPFDQPAVEEYKKSIIQ